MADGPSHWPGRHFLLILARAGFDELTVFADAFHATGGYGACWCIKFKKCDLRQEKLFNPRDESVGEFKCGGFLPRDSFGFMMIPPGYNLAIGDLYVCQGVFCSYANATLRIVASWNGLPKIWRPIGNCLIDPSAVWI